MAKYLVTGAAGFIGSAVAGLLLAQGHEVVGIDNFSRAYDVRLKEWRLAQLRSLETFRFHRLDIAQRQALEECFAQEAARGKPAFDGILNLAAWAGVRRSVKDPWVYYETNVTGTLNLLELARRYEVPKFVLASTSSLYGRYNPMPFREDADTDRTLSPYAASKKAAEVLCYTYHYLYGLDVTVLRYFTVYGPAGRPDMSIFRFIRWIAEGEPVRIYGDGTQKRDFTYVDDIARGTVAALKPLGYEILNLGNDRPVELNRVIELIETYLERKARRMYQPAHPADVPATWADISKAQALLGWRPQISIEEGLHRTVAWYLENRDWLSTLDTPAA